MDTRNAAQSRAGFWFRWFILIWLHLIIVRHHHLLPGSHHPHAHWASSSHHHGIGHHGTSLGECHGLLCRGACNQLASCTYQAPPSSCAGACYESQGQAWAWIKKATGQANEPHNSQWNPFWIPVKSHSTFYGKTSVFCGIQYNTTRLEEAPSEAT